MKSTAINGFVNIFILMFLISGCDKNEELILEVKNSGNVKVVLYAGDKTNPVKGTYIKLCESKTRGPVNAPVIAEQITDKNGEAVFNNIEQGNYWLYNPKLKLSEGVDVNQNSIYYLFKTTQVLADETLIDTINIKEHIGTITLRLFGKNDSLYTNANVYMLLYNSAYYHYYDLLKDEESLIIYACDKQTTDEDGCVTYNAPTGRYSFGIVNKNDSTDISLGHTEVIYIKDTEQYSEIHLDF